MHAIKSLGEASSTHTRALLEESSFAAENYTLRPQGDDDAAANNRQRAMSFE